MSYQPRIPKTFESADGNTTLTFPLAEFEYDSEQGLYVPEVALTGANYGYDQLGLSRPVKQSAQERLRAVVYEDTPDDVDAAIDDLLAKSVEIGRGKLWTQGRVDGSDVDRWAWARAIAMPSLHWAAGDILRKTVSLNFRRYSDWYGDTLWDQGDQPFALSYPMGVPDSITVVNEGSARVFNLVITLAINYLNPMAFGLVSIINNRNQYALTQGNLVDSQYVRFTCGGINRVESSLDAGTTYFSDFANTTLASQGQTSLMVLEPGDNQFDVYNVDDGSIRFDFYPAFH